MPAFNPRDEIGFLPHRPGQPEAINADSFDEDVLQAKEPVLVEFWAARCGSCRRIAPEIAATVAVFPTAARVFTLNVDEELEAALRFGVRSIPAILLFIDGVERARHIGPTTRATLVELFGPHLTATPPNDALMED